MIRIASLFLGLRGWGMLVWNPYAGQGLPPSEQKAPNLSNSLELYAHVEEALNVDFGRLKIGQQSYSYYHVRHKSKEK